MRLEIKISVHAPNALVCWVLLFVCLLAFFFNLWNRIERIFRTGKMKTFRKKSAVTMHVTQTLSGTYYRLN